MGGPDDEINPTKSNQFLGSTGDPARTAGSSCVVASPVPSGDSARTAGSSCVVLTPGGTKATPRIYHHGPGTRMIRRPGNRRKAGPVKPSQALELRVQASTSTSWYKLESSVCLIPMILSWHGSVSFPLPRFQLLRNVTGRRPFPLNVTGSKTHKTPVSIGCGGSKTHKRPMSIGLWRVYRHVAASVAGPTSKIPNVYAVCGAVAGPEGENAGRVGKICQAGRRELPEAYRLFSPLASN